MTNSQRLCFTNRLRVSWSKNKTKKRLHHLSPFTSAKFTLGLLESLISEMSSKQLEKAIDKMIAVHEENLKFWRQVAKEVHKTVEGILNHREQGEMFTALGVNNMEICKAFPDIKSDLLYKLHFISLQLEFKLREFLETFSSQKNSMVELSSQCLSITSATPLPGMISAKPGKTCLAHQLELVHNLATLYSSVLLGLTTWLEGRHTDKSVWDINKELMRVTYYPTQG